jgi:accessory gene regulator protein AgrB
MNRKNTIYYKIAKHVCTKHGIPEDTKYLAMFLDMMAFQFFETALILSIAFLFGIGFETIIVMCSFITFRIGHKGFHTKKRCNCLWMSLALILGLAYVGSHVNLLACFALGATGGVALREKK